MATLVEKMRTAREKTVAIGGFSFTVRRPSELEMIEMNGAPMGRAALPHIVGWSGVKQSDILPNGDPEPQPYDAEIAAEWLTDRVDLLAPLAKAVTESFIEHAAKREAAEKN